MKRYIALAILCVVFVSSTALGQAKAAPKKTAATQDTPILVTSTCQVTAPKVQLFVDPPYNRVFWKSEGGTYVIAFQPWYDSPCATSSSKLGLPEFVFIASRKQHSAYCYPSAYADLDHPYKYEIVRLDTGRDNDHDKDDKKGSKLAVCNDPVVVVTDGGRVRQNVWRVRQETGQTRTNNTAEIRSTCKIPNPVVQLFQSSKDTMQWTTQASGTFTIDFQAKPSPCVDASGTEISSFTVTSAKPSAVCNVNPAAVPADNPHVYSIKNESLRCDVENDEIDVSAGPK